MLIQFVHEKKQDDWDLNLEKLSLAYNTADHAAIKFGPIELIFRRISKLPIDIAYHLTDSDELRAKVEV